MSSSARYEKLVEVWQVVAHSPNGPVLSFLCEEWLPIGMARRGKDPRNNLVFKPLSADRVQELLESYTNTIRRTGSNND